jgi:hypothetical protein
METLENYKLIDFIQVKDETLLQDYLVVLELLEPLKVINNPIYKWYKRKPKTLDIKAVKDLSFGDVATIRSNFSEASIENIIEAVQMVVDISAKAILNITIIEFYGIINYIKSELIEITNMEINELSDDSFDINVEAVNAKERMGKYGVLNTIDSLAKEDILRWVEIEKLPYMTVFTKLRMDNEKAKIAQEIAELQRKNKTKTNV